MQFQELLTSAAVAELADAYDSKSYGKPYGFESHQRHHFFSIYYHIVQKYLQSFLDNRMFYLKGFFYFMKLYSFKTNHSARMCTSKHSLKIKAAAIATASFKNTFCSPTVLLSLIQYTAGRHLLISAVR